MKTAQPFSLDNMTLPRVRSASLARPARAWLPPALLGLVILLLLAALPPRLASICDQDGSLVCGP